MALKHLICRSEVMKSAWYYYWPNPAVCGWTTPRQSKAAIPASTTFPLSWRSSLPILEQFAISHTGDIKYIYGFSATMHIFVCIIIINGRSLARVCDDGSIVVQRLTVLMSVTIMIMMMMIISVFVVVVIVVIIILMVFVMVFVVFILRNIVCLVSALMIWQVQMLLNSRPIAFPLIDHKSENNS